MKKNHLELLEKYTIRKPYKIRMAKVKCDCGTVKDIQWWSWNSGKVKSCGCMRLKLLSDAVPEADARYKHRIHTIWTGMKQRCFNPKTHNYKNYGARGITVCKEWKNNYLSFYEWALQNGYRDDLTIDRIDVNGNYEPTNCRWITIKEQNNNKRPSDEWRHPEKCYALFKGKRVLKATIYRDYNVCPTTVDYRMKKMGKTFEEAVLMNKKTVGRPPKL